MYLSFILSGQCPLFSGQSSHVQSIYAAMGKDTGFIGLDDIQGNAAGLDYDAVHEGRRWNRPRFTAGAGLPGSGQP